MLFELMSFESRLANYSINEVFISAYSSLSDTCKCDEMSELWMGPNELRLASH